MSDDISSLMPSGHDPGAAPGKQKEENYAKENTLAEAKDRAQLTATTAMSIVNVALLKELLDRGPDGNRYYTAVLWLIILSLAFQVIVGALAMMVSHMRSYFKKYGDDMCGDLLANICWVKIKPQKDKKHDKCDGEHGVKCCCLPLNITTNVHPHYEYKVIDQYDDWCSTVTDAELRAAEANVHLDFISAATKDARERIAILESEKQNAAITEAEYKSKVEEIERRLATARARKDDYMMATEEMSINRNRGLILADKVGDIRRDRVLKQISFWQDIINYMLYFVFIFNAFIAGLGIFGGTSSTAVVADAASAATAAAAAVTGTP